MYSQNNDFTKITDRLINIEHTTNFTYEWETNNTSPFFVNFTNE